MSKIIFTTLAINQTTFFLNIAKKLEENGHQVFFVCFDEKSHRYLKERGADSYNVFDVLKRQAQIDESGLEQYNIENLDLLLNHEKAYYNLSNFSKQKKKLAAYLMAVTSIFKEIGSNETILFQEFGGFLSVASAFYSARFLNIDNIFIEPSFFKGRVIFQRNTYFAVYIPQTPNIVITDDIKKILNEITTAKAVVIPDKDKKQYRSAVSKILDTGNIIRVLQKIVFKYILRRQQEFHYIGLHIWRHLKMAFNKARIQKRYLDKIGTENYMYFPLHVPNDASLTIRSPAYFDQIGLLKRLSRDLPTEFVLYIKEHPALTGAFNYRQMVDLLNSCNNIRLLDSSMNNYDVVGNARIVLTVNSKAGAEALLLGKSVLVLGDAFYRGSEDVTGVKSIEELSSCIKMILENDFKVDMDRVYSYFGDIWNNSWCGELYLNEPENIEYFSESLQNCIKA